MTKPTKVFKIEVPVKKFRRSRKDWDGHCHEEEAYNDGAPRQCEAPELCWPANCCFREGTDKPLVARPTEVVLMVPKTDLDRALNRIAELESVAPAASSTDAEGAQQAVREPAICGVLAGEPEVLGERCKDGGKCHHACTNVCFRRDGNYCGPLTGSRLNGDWSEPTPSQQAVKTDAAPAVDATVERLVADFKAAARSHPTAANGYNLKIWEELKDKLRTALSAPTPASGEKA